MTRFMFSLVGTSQTPILELPVYSAAQLNAAISRARFIDGMMVQIDGEVVNVPVLIPVSRIQMIMELPE
jgi:hypothetical protein